MSKESAQNLARSNMQSTPNPNPPKDMSYGDKKAYAAEVTRQQQLNQQKATKK